jgi:hypothetical protein
MAVPDHVYFSKDLFRTDLDAVPAGITSSGVQANEIGSSLVR